MIRTVQVIDEEPVDLDRHLRQDLHHRHRQHHHHHLDQVILIDDEVQRIHVIVVQNDNMTVNDDDDIHIIDIIIINNTDEQDLDQEDGEFIFISFFSQIRLFGENKRLLLSMDR
jgi:hypothetical protein